MSATVAIRAPFRREHPTLAGQFDTLAAGFVQGEPPETGARDAALRDVAWVGLAAEVATDDDELDPRSRATLDGVAASVAALLLRRVGRPMLSAWRSSLELDDPVRWRFLLLLPEPRRSALQAAARSAFVVSGELRQTHGGGGAAAWWRERLDALAEELEAAAGIEVALSVDLGPLAERLRDTAVTAGPVGEPAGTGSR